MGDVVNDIEIRPDDPDLAPQVAEEADASPARNTRPRTGKTRTASFLHALKMEREVTVVTIGLIEMVGALNIFIALTMIVLTKYRDIAVLMSMGARRAQIRRIFIMQGAMIGIVGTALGLITGYTLCYFADRYHWMPLNESIYALSFVPFEPRL